MWDDDEMDEFEGFAFGDELVTDIIKKAQQEGKAKPGGKKKTPLKAKPELDSEEQIYLPSDDSAAAASSSLANTLGDPTSQYQDRLTDKRAKAAGLEIQNMPPDGNCALHAVIKALLGSVVAPQEGEPENKESTIANQALDIIDTFFDIHPNILPAKTAKRSVRALRILLVAYIFHGEETFAVDVRNRLYAVAEQIDNASKEVPPEDNQVAMAYPQIARSMTGGYAKGGLDISKLEKIYSTSAFYAEETMFSAMRCLLPIRFIIIDPGKVQETINVQKQEETCTEFDARGWILLKRIYYEKKSPHFMLLRPLPTNSGASGPLMSQDAAVAAIRALGIMAPVLG